MTAHLAIDLGAESGRAIVGALDGDRLTLEELHRFTNRPRRLPGGMHWDLLGLFGEVLEGLRRAVIWSRDNRATLLSVGVDSWGVDFGLLSRSGELLGLPRCYRDPRHAAGFSHACDAVGRARLWERTGIQALPFNTLFQLVAQRLAEPGILDQAAHLLFIPDLMHHFLSGERAIEATIASTSQLLDARTRAWATDLLEELGLPAAMLSPPVAPGTPIGTLTLDVAAEAGAMGGLQVVAPGAHDTASAVAAVPASGDRAWCFLSSGTWSLLGAELSAPVLTGAAREAGFTNEGGVQGTTRFLKNLTGLWLVQECRRDFARSGQALDFAQLADLAATASPFAALIDPAHEPFGQPGRMPAKIGDYARRTGQRVPAGPGAFVRCCLESLALAYRHTLLELEGVLERRFDVLHIVGGGGRNALLDQMTADAIGRPVIVGPHEATAAGNVLVQAMGLGEVEDLGHARRIALASFETRTFEPADGAPWDEAYERYCGLVAT